MRTKIIYEDSHILVCYKPAGLATQTSHVGQPDVVSELRNYLGKGAYLGVIHRLDQPVEGLLVFAKTKDAAAKITGQLSGGTLNKRYYALICGKPSEKAGRLVNYLVKEGSVGRVGSAEEKEAKCAVLQYEILQDWDGEYSLADIRIETGRFHQIRLQMAYAGHPILGDQKYGSLTSQECSCKKQIKNVALCAYALELLHPVSKKKMHFSVEASFMEKQS